MALLLNTDIRRLSSGVAINAMALTTSTLLPAFSKPLVIMRVVLRVVLGTAVATPASMKVQKNPAAGDIFGTEVLTGVTATNDTFTFNAEAKGIVVPAGTPIDLTVTTAATGTTLNIEADLFGYILY
jgi:hypothetical protein